jgi:hypothetical protein
MDYGLKVVELNVRMEEEEEEWGEHERSMSWDGGEMELC